MGCDVSGQRSGLNLVRFSNTGLQPKTNGGQLHLLTHGGGMKGSEEGLSPPEGRRELDVALESPSNIKVMPLPVERVHRMRKEIWKHQLLGSVKP